MFKVQITWSMIRVLYNLTLILQVNLSGFDLNWADSMNSGVYKVKYSPQGDPKGENKIKGFKAGEKLKAWKKEKRNCLK